MCGRTPAKVKHTRVCDITGHDSSSQQVEVGVGVEDYSQCSVLLFDRDAEDGVHGVRREALLPGRQVSGTSGLGQTLPGCLDLLVLSQVLLCFRCVWSQKGNTTMPSSRKWEHTPLPSPSSSRSWERSNTHLKLTLVQLSEALTQQHFEL